MKLIKFDNIHPQDYLLRKQEEWKDALGNLSLVQYRTRLNQLRSNYSDFYTYNLNQLGDWQAEEFYLHDRVFTDKLSREIYGSTALPRKIWNAGRVKPLGVNKEKWTEKLIEDYIVKKKPDVLFVRTHSLRSAFWKKFDKQCLLVARLSASLPYHWHPYDWDLIYTDIEHFKTFFTIHGTPTILNKQGFDERIPKELVQGPKKYPYSFVGGLGMRNFKNRTLFLNELAQDLNFIWWGYWWDIATKGERLEDFPKLAEKYQGSTSGREMYQIYRDSCMVLNDYVDTANGIGFNQRMFEVMGCGSLLMTRQAKNFAKTFPKDIFVTFNSKADLIDKANYYLKNEKEREEIAKAGQDFVLAEYNYKEIANDFAQDVRALYQKKFG
jgi:hypothetical protein